MVEEERRTLIREAYGMKVMCLEDGTFIGQQDGKEHTVKACVKITTLGGDVRLSGQAVAFLYQLLKGDTEVRPFVAALVAREEANAPSLV